MPSETFFRLSKEKQNCILKAAMKEFSRVPYHEASINQMIKNSNISRGSFYMYFHDKDDLYQYLIETHQRKLKQKFKLQLEKHQGDLFETYLAIFQNVIDKIETGKDRLFVEKMITNTNFKNDVFFKQQPFQQVILESLYDEVDLSNRNMIKKSDLVEVIDFIHMIFIHNLIGRIQFGLTKEEALEKMKRQLSILKNGLYEKERAHD